MLVGRLRLRPARWRAAGAAALSRVGPAVWCSLSSASSASSTASAASAASSAASASGAVAEGGEGGLRGEVLGVYRSLLRLALRLPAGVRVQAVSRVRNEFRENRKEEDAARVQEMLAKARSSEDYLRISTPKGHTGQSEPTRLVVYKGTVMDAAEAQRRRSEDGMAYRGEEAGRGVTSNWDGQNLDPDCVARHYHGLRRAGFRDNLHAKGGMF